MSEPGRDLVNAIEELVKAVEGINGAMNYGTFYAEKGGVRLKDTPEWVALYVAWGNARKAASESAPAPLGSTRAPTEQEGK